MYAACASKRHNTTMCAVRSSKQHNAGMRVKSALSNTKQHNAHMCTVCSEPSANEAVHVCCTECMHVYRQPFAPIGGEPQGHCYAIPSRFQDPGLQDPATGTLGRPAAIRDSRRGIGPHGGLPSSWEMVTNCLLFGSWRFKVKHRRLLGYPAGPTVLDTRVREPRDHCIVMTLGPQDPDGTLRRSSELPNHSA